MIERIVEGRRVLVTGGTGSLGLALAARLGTAKHVRIFSRDEKKQLDMRHLFPEFEYRLGDMSDAAAVRNAVLDMDVIVHGASLKYVDISEQQPNAYVTTNVVGTQNLLAAVLQERTVQLCVGISSDKAAQPINVYGMTKALLERLFMEAHERRGDKIPTAFTIARYGNVLGTRGSVVPRWAELRKLKMPLQITDPAMTRFFFTMDEALDLIDVAFRCPSGSVVSKAMRSCTLGDLAEVMATNGVRIVGRRPGEKIHEMLLSAEEMERTLTVAYESGPSEFKDAFLFRPSSPVILSKPSEAYTSDDAPRLTRDELLTLLQEYLEA